ncbi:hypothetical protein F5Y05DRAFT_337188 [Hypoxylon sp. FL0543]|nr:hypothetical protein F5Y05DRAFT_337188 [Hypoxylon sp. FL0543]
MEVIGTRDEARSENAIDGSEDEWGFGQILPVLLLVLPATSILEVYQEARERKRSQKKNAAKADSETGDLPLGPSNQISIFDQPAAIYPSPPSKTEGHDVAYLGNETRRQLRQDTESRVGIPDTATDSTITEDASLNLPRRMYESRLFRAWMVLCMLAAFGLATYAALQGYAF